VVKAQAEAAQQQVQNAIPKLLAMGLTQEQVTEALGVEIGVVDRATE
jgi:predicted transposase YdaD